MKKVYTSNYARNGNNPNAFGISYSVPNWFEGERLPLLAPEWNMVDSIKKGQMNELEYTKRYLTLLHHRNIKADELIEALPDGAILLCFEKPGDFCHRRILAEWVKHETGIEIPEWKNEKEQQKEVQDNFVDSLIDF